MNFQFFVCFFEGGSNVFVNLFDISSFEFVRLTFFIALS